MHYRINIGRIIHIPREQQPLPLMARCGCRMECPAVNAVGKQRDSGLRMLLLQERHILNTAYQVKREKVQNLFILGNAPLFYLIKQPLPPGPGNLTPSFPIKRKCIGEVQYHRPFGRFWKILGHAQMLHMYGIKMFLSQQIV